LGGDPDGDAVTYNIHFGMDELPPLIVNDWNGNYFNPFELLNGPMEAAQTYYWQIIADDDTSTTDGPIWAFTTATTLPGGPSFSEHIITTDFLNPYHIFPGDLDGDDDIDLVCSGGSEGDLEWWANDGTGNGWVNHTIASDLDYIKNIFVIDLDNDEDLDVIVSGAIRDELFWYENSGTGTVWNFHSIQTSLDAVRSMHAADMDNDGDIDILASVQTARDLILMENTTGDGTLWTQWTIDAEFLGSFDVSAGDLDNDGDLDVAASAHNGRDVVWWESDGSIDVNNWVYHPIDLDFGGAGTIDIADFNGDGWLDILCPSQDENVIRWWENNEPGNEWTAHDVVSYFGSITYTIPVDIDNDGDIDVFGGRPGTDEIRLYRNLDGSGISWYEQYIDQDQDGVSSLAVADLDNDNDLDLICTNAVSDEIVWYETLTYAAPVPFDYLEPENNTYVTNDTVTVRWNQSYSPEGEQITYRVEWAIDELFTRTYYGTTTDTFYTINGLLNQQIDEILDGTSLYWRVIATEIYNSITLGNDGEPWMFISDQPDRPFYFHLLSPTNYTEFPEPEDFPITFVWEAADDNDLIDTVSYTFELSDDPSFSEINVTHVGRDTFFVLDELANGNYYWRIQATDLYDLSTQSLETWTLTVALGVNESSTLPHRYEITELYPNPFNPTLTAVIALPEAASLTVQVYNINGQMIDEIANTNYSAGYQKLVWDGSKFSSGVYFISVSIPDRFSQVRKVVLVK